jgi:deoxyribonuclease-2
MTTSMHDASCDGSDPRADLLGWRLVTKSKMWRPDFFDIHLHRAYTQKSKQTYPSFRAAGYQGLSSTTYGQSFLCVTFAASKLDAIGGQLQTMWPYVYDAGMSADMQLSYPIFAAAVLTPQTHVAEAGQFAVASLTSLGRRSFTSYATSAKTGTDLFEGVVAPSLGAALKVESWMNGAISNRIPTSCAAAGFAWDVEDISAVSMPDGTSWKETQDHSKWAVSYAPAAPASQATAVLNATSGPYNICVCDKNRQVSQAKRGGGCLCYSNSYVHSAFASIVGEVADPCSR